MLNAPELMIIAGVVIVMFGGNKLPKLGSAVGETIKNFKNSVKDEEKERSKITAPKSEDADNK